MIKKNNKINKLILAVFIFVILFLGIYYNKSIINKVLEGFIVTVDEVILGTECPDYLSYDGNNYYLVFNNKEFDGINNPLTFNDINSVKNKLNSLNCPIKPYIDNIINLRYKRNNDDPTENIERRCAKHIALNKFGIDNCAFDYAYGGSPDLQKEFSSLSFEELAKMANSSKLDELEPKIQKMNVKSLDNYKKIRKLVDFINQTDESIMVDYDLETCMFEKVGDLLQGNTDPNTPSYLQENNLGSKKGLHEFRKYFGQQQQMLSSNANASYEDLNYENELDDNNFKEFIMFFNDANNVISNDVIEQIYQD